jgi:hypothetical protein
MRNQVLNALRDELSLSSKARSFEVDWIELVGDSWVVSLDLSISVDRLDESLEGAMAWWQGEPRNGAAEVLCVVPEEQQITLRFATRKPPQKGGIIKIYPPRYLESLMAIWERDENAQLAEEWFNTVPDSDDLEPDCIPPMDEFQEKLRLNQKKAFELFGRRCGFLWGPPGTGKTFTIGVMLAQYMVHCPNVRILLMSTTNAATDQVLVAVDKALENVATSEATKTELRKRCKRIGSKFLAKYYDGRHHLLPVSDHLLVRQLTQLQADCPQKTDTAAYAKWKEAEEAVRERIRRQSMDALDSASLAAMTTTRAAFGFNELLEKGRFDVLVMDEASQVSTVHAVTLARLAECTIFAGDPKQLAPIVQSKQDNTLRWLGHSMFNEVRVKSPGMYMLTEQSRMAPDICSLVSTCFYDRKLVVASREGADAKWRTERRLMLLPGLPAQATMIQDIPYEAKYSRKYGGKIRYESAEKICDIVQTLLLESPANEIVVLTPFRSQRALIRMLMQHRNLGNIAVRTVHSSQGMEYHSVIFDPVDGSSAFLREYDARCLVNVALSRAKARLIILLSSSDRLNPLFDEVARTVEFVSKPKQVPSLRELVRSHSRSRMSLALGQLVIHDNKDYEIVKMSSDENSDKLTLRCTETGRERTATITRKK